MSRFYGTFEIDDIEYGPAPEGVRGPGRANVDEFMVGDRIGTDRYLITASRPGTEPDSWALTWLLSDGTEHEYEGPRTSNDFRWVQTMYIIKEREEL